MTQRVPGRVDHLPAVPPDVQHLPSAQPTGCLDDRVQVGHPAGQVVGQVGALRFGDPVVGVGVPAPRACGVRMAVLLAVEVGQGVHGQLGTGELHQPARQPVVVDVRVGDEDPGDVPQRVAGRLQPCLHGRKSPVGQVRPPHPAVDDGDPVAVGEDVQLTLSTAFTPIGSATRVSPSA